MSKKSKRKPETAVIAASTFQSGIDPDEPIPFVLSGPSKPAWDSPEALATWDTETAELVSEKEKAVSELEEKYELRKEAAKDAKERLEVGEKELRELIRTRRYERGRPPQPAPASLFDDPQPDVPAEVHPLDDAWKATPLSELVEHDGLPQKLSDLLSDNGIDTLGKLADYELPNATGYQKRLTDIQGLGPAKREKIDAATEAYWLRVGRSNASSSKAGSEDPGDDDGDTEANEASIAIPRGLPD